MVMRVFYWNPVPGRSSILGRFRREFRVGNAGDLLNRDLVEQRYDEVPTSFEDGGNRVLFVGSVAHRVQDGDWVAGIGTKGVEIPGGRDLRLVGVRGPLTEAAFKSAGYDTSSIKFHGDPGLLVGRMYRDLETIRPVAGRRIFIPHYRDLRDFRTQRAYKVVSVDATVHDFATQIAKSEFVYTSSLHGLIFAHALGRPAVLVASRRGEPEIKYRDYFASVGLPWRRPDDIDSVVRQPTPSTPHDVQSVIDSIRLPSMDELRASGVVEP